jgi:hypothetical protein
VSYHIGTGCVNVRYGRDVVRGNVPPVSADSLVGCCAATEHLCSTSCSNRACLVSEIGDRGEMQNQPNGKAGVLSDAAAVAAVEAEISRIQTLKPDEARALWRDTFKRDVPKALTRDLLVRTLCWYIQEKAFGGHSSAMLKLLASFAKGRSGDGHRLRRLQPGTELVREYQGERHTVVITGEGFRWRGKDYSSLTAIARTITGSNWNGPRFFGLREGPENPGGRRSPAETAGKTGMTKGLRLPKDGARG